MPHWLCDNFDAMEPIKNWIATSNYDLRTAEAMHKTGRYLYVVFMCHMAMEKMLKAVLAQKFPDKIPPKIHNLVPLYQKAQLILPEPLLEFTEQMDNVSIVTRYPEDLRMLSRQFDKEHSRLVLKKTKEFLSWLKQNALT